MNSSDIRHYTVGMSNNKVERYEKIVSVKLLVIVIIGFQNLS